MKKKGLRSPRVKRLSSEHGTTRPHLWIMQRRSESRNVGTEDLQQFWCLKNCVWKKFFSIFEEKMLKENHRSTPHKYQQLPLPPMMVSKMMRIFSCTEYLIFVRNPVADCVPRIHMQMNGKHALGDCKLQLKNYSYSMMKKICTPSQWVAAQKINKDFFIFPFHHNMVHTNKNLAIRTMNRLQTEFKILQRNFCAVVTLFERSYWKFFNNSKKNMFLLSGFHCEQLIWKVRSIKINWIQQEEKRTRINELLKNISRAVQNISLTLI